MSSNRSPAKDPRTVARDIPGILDCIFPQLHSGLVAYLNRQAVAFPGINAMSEPALEANTLKPAMLFELAVARAEQLLRDESSANWGDCLSVAVSRQRRHFDASIPGNLTDNDMILAETAAVNLFKMLSQIARKHPDQMLNISPEIPGYSWIASGNVDFTIGETLIEVKFIDRNYSASDFRQVLMYWILSYANSIENNGTEFTNCILLNPRKNCVLSFKFSMLLNFSSAGMGKIEVLQKFDSIVSDSAIRLAQTI